MNKALVCALCLLSARVARAHDGVALQPWSPNLWLVAGLTLASAAYARGAYLIGPARKVENAAFAVAIVTLLLALVSPLDELSDTSFAAHMTQHELLMLLAAPLLVLARPLPVYLRALPARARAQAATYLRKPSLVRAFRLLSAPALVLLVHGLVRWIWHIPALFESAMDDEWVHGIQHASFFATAALFWWGMVQGRYGRAGYGMAFLFVLLTAMHTGALGALLSFSEHGWYPSYQRRAGLSGIDVVSDQQVAGLIMWVGAGLWMMLLALSLFVAWLGEAQSRVRRGSVASLHRQRGQSC